MAWSFVLNVIEDKIVNKILSMNILEEMSLVYRIWNMKYLNLSSKITQIEVEL